MAGLGGMISRAFGRGRSASPTETIGTTGHVIVQGYLQRNEKNPSVKGEQRYLTFSDMITNADIVGASIRFYLNLFTAAGWSVEAADPDDPQAVEVKEFVEDCMDDMRTPWHRVVRRAAMFRWYGFSIQEWTAKERDDGRIGFLDVEPRPQSTICRWDVDAHGNVEGCTQRNANTGDEVYLPRAKTVYVVDDSLSDSPEGLGILRHMVETWQRLKRYQDIEKFAFETDLQGIPVVRAPLAVLDKQVEDGALSKQQRTDLVKVVKDFAANHIRSKTSGIMLDSAVYADKGETAAPSSVPLWDVSLVTGEGSAFDAIAKSIERLQRELARLAGTEGLLLGGDKVGSLALSQDKTNNFGLIVDSSLLEVKKSFEHDWIAPLMELNGIDAELWPTLVTEQIQYRDVNQLTSALEALSRAGATLAPDDPAINILRRIMGLPDQPEMDPMLDASLRGDGTGGEDDPPAPDDPAPDDMPEPTGEE